MTHRRHNDDQEILRTEREILRETQETHREVEEIERRLRPHYPTAITFKELTMNPTAAGQSQVFTGTLAPAGSILPPDAAFTITSNDTLVSPSVDATGLIVSVTYPAGWVENATTPLAFTYGATSASVPSFTLSATITPSAPPAPFATSITFTQTQ